VGTTTDDAGPGAGAAIGAHLRRTVSSIAAVVETDVGWTARCDELPLVHTLNQVHVTAAAPPDRLLAATASHQAHLGYRHLVVEDPGTAGALRDVLSRSHGWKTDREVWMALREPPARQVDTSRVTELTEDETVCLMKQWLLEEGLDGTPGVVDQLAEYQRREGRAWTERRFGVRAADGAPVAVTKLRSDGDGTAWVEDVYALASARGRGHGRALVTHAVNRARAEGNGLTFIVADDDDWPKHLYHDVGFRPSALAWTFHRDASTG
jgi:GNAT superfamily N-acetyltransferase